MSEWCSTAVPITGFSKPSCNLDMSCQMTDSFIKFFPFMIHGELMNSAPQPQRANLNAPKRPAEEVNPFSPQPQRQFISSDTVKFPSCQT